MRIGTLVLTAGLLPLSGCSPCGNELQQVLQQPNGFHRAVLFERDCGATTGFSEQVSILGTFETLGNNAGNVFVIDDNHGAASSNIQIRWLDEKKLQIAYPAKARVFSRKDAYAGVDIVYITFEQLADQGKNAH